MCQWLTHLRLIPLQVCQTKKKRKLRSIKAKCKALLRENQKKYMKRGKWWKMERTKKQFFYIFCSNRRITFNNRRDLQCVIIYLSHQYRHTYSFLQPLNKAEVWTSFDWSVFFPCLPAAKQGHNSLNGILNSWGDVFVLVLCLVFLKCDTA